MNETYTATERCAVCTLAANVDPALHQQRYGHTPEVWRDGQRLRFDFRTWTFRRQRGDQR